MRFERALTRYRDHLVGTRGCFVLRPRREFSLPSVASVDLYIHIPFCRSLCPYCPYNRVRYDRDAADAYLKAVTHEIDRYGEDLGAVEIGSVYIGGGTPTTMLNGLETILDKIRYPPI